MFYIIFLAEMIIKLVGFGFKGYFSDYRNTLDSIIVFLSSIDVIIFFLPVNGEEENQTMSRLGTVSQVFRIFRLLRVFKIAKSWKTFNYFLVTMANTLQKISTFILLMYLFIFMYTILGMEMFSNQVRFNLDNQPIPPFDGLREDTSLNWDIPFSNFNNFLSATTSVFIVLANDGWTTIYFDISRASSPVMSTIFFLSLVILGQMILFNLFLSMLLKEFDEGEMITENHNKRKSICKRIFRRCCGNKREELSKEEQEKKKHQKRLDKQKKAEEFIAKNKSLGIFSEENPLRILCRQITNIKAQAESGKQGQIEQSNWFDNFILLTITVSSILLAFESPLNDPEGSLYNFLVIFDYITTTIFCFEVIIKVIATGFMLNGKKSYIRNSWNIMDFVIVVISIVSLIPMDANLSVLKVIRMARLLRPLRVISKNENLKLSIQALVVATPAIGSLLVIFMLVMFIFGIIAVNMFKGKSFYCDYSSILGLNQKEIELLIVTKADCLNYGGSWKLKHYHFDNIQNSLMNMIIMSQTVNWAPIMYSIVNSGGPNLVPVFNNQPLARIFFILFIIFGAFFMTNLFVGVVINAFNKASEKLGKNFLLTAQQQQWIQTKVLLLNTQPKIAMIKPQGSPFREVCFKIATHTYFTVFILVAIVLNTITLCIKWPNMSEQDQQMIENANYFFTAVFTLEAIFKLIAFGSRYFKDNWNLFDFVIVVTSLTFILIAQTSNVDLGTTAQVIRTLRVGRMLKFFKSFKQMKIIFQTFLNSMSSLINVGGLLFLIIYIFAVIGISLFADIKVQAPMHNRLNFQNIFNAYVTLIRISTGESWNDLMNVLSMGQTLENDCVYNPTYKDFIEKGEPVACGNTLYAYSFFFLFLTIVTLAFLNLFIAIILTGYFDSRNLEKKTLNSAILEEYQEQWSHLDPNATGQVPISKLPKLMFKIGKPLGWDKKFKGKKEKQTTFIDMIREKMPEAPEDGEVMANFSVVLDELALIYVLKQEVINQMEGANFSSSEGEDEEEKPDVKLDKRRKSIALMNQSKTIFMQAEGMKEAKIVQNLQRKKTKLSGSLTPKNRKSSNLGSQSSQWSKFRPNINRELAEVDKTNKVQSDESSSDSSQSYDSSNISSISGQLNSQMKSKSSMSESKNNIDNKSPNKKELVNDSFCTDKDMKNSVQNYEEHKCDQMTEVGKGQQSLADGQLFGMETQRQQTTSQYSNADKFGVADLKKFPNESQTNLSPKLKQKNEESQENLFLRQY